MSARLHARSKASTRAAKASAKPARASARPAARSARPPIRSPRPATRGGRPAPARRKSPVTPVRSRKVPGRTGPGRTTKPGSARKQAQASHAVRRNRVPVALAALFAVVVLATSFPLSGLLAQHRQLSAATAQLTQLQRQNSQLAVKQRQLSSTAEIKRLARQDYQLVSPGQTLYDILPAAGQTASTSPGGALTGDPGNQPLVAPANAPAMSPDPGLPQAPAVTGSGTSSSATPGGGSPSGSGKSGASLAGGTGGTQVPSSFWSRVTNTLEFWK